MMFVSDESEAGRSQCAPGDVASPQPEALPKHPPDELQYETSSTEPELLSGFLPEDPVFLQDDLAARIGSTRAHTSEHHQASRHLPDLSIRGSSAAARPDSTSLDDLRTLLRRTEVALERSNSDANALQLDLSRLRKIGAQLSQEYARLDDACRLTEKRTEMSGDALNAIENRLGPLEVVRDLTNSTDDRLASLRRLAEEVMDRAADFEARKKSMDHALVEVTRVTDLLAALENRVTKLTEKHEQLRHAEETVGNLERRIAETTAHLERRVNDFEAQGQTIDHALVEAARVTHILSALHVRVATLRGLDQLLGHAEETVEHVERRAAEGAVRLEQGRQGTNGELEQELANIQKQLQTLTESARNNIEMLANHQQRDEIHHLMSVSRSRPVPEPNAYAGATSRRAQKTRQLVQCWAAVLGAC
jgi:chromosome segregation ATPase